MQHTPNSLAIHYLCWLALSAPLAMLHSLYNEAELAQEAAALELRSALLPQAQLSSQFGRTFHAAPLAVRCTGCGKLWGNAGGSPCPVIPACWNCELEPVRYPIYHAINWQLRAAGWHNLSREDMMAYNELCRVRLAASNRTESLT